MRGGSQAGRPAAASSGRSRHALRAFGKLANRQGALALHLCNIHLSVHVRHVRHMHLAVRKGLLIARPPPRRAAGGGGGSASCARRPRGWPSSRWCPSTCPSSPPSRRCCRRGAGARGPAYVAPGRRAPAWDAMPFSGRLRAAIVPVTRNQVVPMPHTPRQGRPGLLSAWRAPQATPQAARSGVDPATASAHRCCLSCTAETGRWCGQGAVGRIS
jgi:hypothetical protein